MWMPNPLAGLKHGQHLFGCLSSLACAGAITFFMMPLRSSSDFVVWSITILWYAGLVVLLTVNCERCYKKNP